MGSYWICRQALDMMVLGEYTGGRDRPSVLVLGEGIPVPANTGKRIRTLNLLRRLSDEFEIHLLVHADEAVQEYADSLAEHGLTVHVARSSLQKKHGLRFFLRLAASLFSPHPYSVTSHYRREYANLLRSLLGTKRYDLIHCEWTPYARYVADVDLPCVISAHNVESEVWRRLALSEDNRVLGTFWRLQAWKMERFERRVFNRCSYATTVSSRDATTIARWGCQRVVVVPNGVDLGYYNPLPAAPSDSRDLVFVGSMDWRANQDAVRWFVTEIHPRLRAMTKYQLWVIGRNPPDWMREATALPPEVRVTGEVPDVRPYLERAAVAIVPLRVGGGSRLKILEAMACARPVVSTTIGAEGLNVVPGRDVLLADDSADFADQLAGLLRSTVLRERLAAAGRRLVETQYDWDRIHHIQREMWREALRET